MAPGEITLLVNFVFQLLLVGDLVGPHQAKSFKRERERKRHVLRGVIKGQTAFAEVIQFITDL